VEGQRLSHLLHDTPVDALELIAGDGSPEGDVERRMVGPDPRAFLDDMLTKRLAQCFVQKMSCRVVARDLMAPGFVNLGSDAVLQPDFAYLDPAEMRNDTR
jgi:hypothetical protein